MSKEPPSEDGALDARVTQLELVVARLEALVEGLQDVIHQQATRYDRDIDELRVRTVPAQMARDLSEDARRRGL